MKKIFFITFLLVCFSLKVSADTDGENSLSKKDNKPVKDCFEKVNRATFAFNEGLDKAIFEPLAKGYRLLPNPVRIGTSNVLSNLSNLLTIPNNILQGNIQMAAINSGRLVVNTTIGILGIFDPATNLGLEKGQKEDYGQTLGAWGVGEGCYIVLPVLGPSTTRDVVGSIGSLVVGGDPWYNITVRNDTHYFADFDYYFSRAGTGVDFRAKNLESLDNLEKNSMDFYASVKSLYLQDRKQKVMNSSKVLDAMDDGNWEEIE